PAHFGRLSRARSQPSVGRFRAQRGGSVDYQAARRSRRTARHRRARSRHRRQPRSRELPLPTAPMSLHESEAKHQDDVECLRDECREDLHTGDHVNKLRVELLAVKFPYWDMARIGPHGLERVMQPANLAEGIAEMLESTLT